MIDVVLKLIDKTTDLLKRREQQRADLFKNFVEPAWKDLEVVHQNYLATFRNYIEQVSDTKSALNHDHPVFRAIELDSLFSDTMRAKVAEAQRLAENDSRLHEFVRSLIAYLCAVPRALETQGNDEESIGKLLAYVAPICMPRVQVKKHLRLAANESEELHANRRLAVLHLSAALEALQRAYCDVMRNYMNRPGFRGGRLV